MQQHEIKILRSNDDKVVTRETIYGKSAAERREKEINRILDHDNFYTVMMAMMGLQQAR
jgi:hypothetical protein